MSILFKLACIGFWVVANSSSAQATTLDVVTTYSDNLISVEKHPTEPWVKMSYCPNKNDLSQCQLIGKGWYSQQALSEFRGNQKVKAALNAAGAIGGTVGGFYLTLIGGLAVPPAGAIPGILLFAGGVKSAGSFISNLNTLWNLSEPLIQDEVVDLTTSWEDYESITGVGKNDPGALEEMKKFSNRKILNLARELAEAQERVNHVE